MLSEYRPVDPQLAAVLRRLKLGPLSAVLPERLGQARQNGMDPEDFLLVLLGDEAERRSQNAATLRAAKAGLAPDMVLDGWDRQTAVRYDRELLDRLMTLTFLDRHEHVCVMGPVGVGKTMLAQGLGHIASARGKSVAYHSLTFDRIGNFLTASGVCSSGGEVDAAVGRAKLGEADVRRCAVG